MGNTPKKPDMYSKINNLLSENDKRYIARMKEELEQSRKEIQKEAENLRKEKENLYEEFYDKSSPNSHSNPITGTTFQNRQRMAYIPNPSFPKPSIGNYYQNYNTIQPKTKKTAQLRTIDKSVIIDNIELFTPATHVVRLSTRVTSQYQQHGTKKIIGMEKVDWWEYVLIYGFFKATKLAYEYNIVKDLIKNPAHVVSLVNKGVLVLTFVPRKSNDLKEVVENIKGEDVVVKTGTWYRDFKLSIEIPYKTVTKVEEKKKGFFLYEETFETIEPDYEALGAKVSQELDDKKINEGFKLIIANEIKNGRVSRV
jgi:hypothetical protein